MRALFLYACLFVAGAAAGQPVATKVDTRSSELSYSGTSMVHNFTGVSKRVGGTLVLDLQVPARSRIEIAAPVESFDSGNSNRDSNMLDAVEAERYPDVRFTSTQITAEGPGTWIVRGNLSFHGQVRPVEVPVRVSTAGGVFEGSGTFPISLTAFKVKRPKLLLKPIGDEIVVAFTIRAPI